MSGFAKGFGMGQQAYQNAVDSKRQDVLDARAATEFQQRQDALARGLKVQREQDDAFGAYRDLTQNGTVKNNTTGMTDASVAMLNKQGGQQAVDDTASYGNAEAARMGLRGPDMAMPYRTSLPQPTPAPAPQEGQQYAAPPLPAAQPTYAAQAADPRALLEARRRIAVSKQDMAGMSAIEGEDKKLRYSEGYAQHKKAFDGMDDAARQKITEQLSYDTGVKAYATWTPGSGKNGGYATILPQSGGDPIRLSRKEAGELYALQNLMEIDPDRARMEMSKVSDKVEAAAKTLLDVQVSAAKVNNDAASSMGREAHQAAALNQQAAAQRAQLGLQQSRYAQQDRKESAQTGQREQMVKISSAFSGLTTEEQNGPKGLALRHQYNMASAKVGGQVALGNAGRPEREMPDKVLPKADTWIKKGDGRVVVADGKGGELSPNAWKPEKIKQTLLDAGFSEAQASRVQINSDGSKAAYGDMQFDYTNPESIKDMKKTADAHDVVIVQSGEADLAARTGGLRPSAYRSDAALRAEDARKRNEQRSKEYGPERANPFLLQ